MLLTKEIHQNRKIRYRKYFDKERKKSPSEQTELIRRKNVLHHFFRQPRVVIEYLFLKRREKEIDVIQPLAKSTNFLSLLFNKTNDWF
jgi:hypothetical protein